MPASQAFSNRQARLVVDSAVDYAIIGVGIDGIVTFWNTGAEHIMGWTSEEAVGRHGKLIFTPEDADAGIPAAEMSAALRTGRGIDERWHVKKDGSRFWATGEMMPLKNDAGDLEGYVKILRDRTEQHMASTALVESEERYEDLYNAIDKGFCLIEVSCDDLTHPVDYRFLKVNTAFERQTGLADAVGNWVRQLLPGHEEHWFDVYAKVATTGVPARFELPAKVLNRWYEVFAYRVGKPEDRVVAVLFSDVTRQHTAESHLKASERHLRDMNKVLRGSEANLRLLLDTIDEGFYAVDRDGLTLTCNAAFLRMMGFERAEDVIGKRLHGLMHHSHADGSAYPEKDCPIYIAASQGIAAHVEGEQFFPQHGAPVWVDYRATPVVQDGVLQGAICTFQDVSDERTRKLALLRDTERQAALIQLNDGLRNLDDLERMSALAASIVGRTIGVSAAGLGLVDTRQDLVVIDRDWTTDPAYSVVGDHPMHLYGSYMKDLRAGRSVVIKDVHADARTAGHTASFDRLGVRALVNAPIVEQGRLVALFCVLSKDVRDWDAKEVAFILEVAERTRLAIERRRAEQELKSADRLRFALADLSDRLRSLENVDAMQIAAAEVIGLALRVDRVGYGQVLEDDETFVVPNDWTEAGFPSLAGRYKLDDYGLYAHDLRHGRTVVVEDVAADPRTRTNADALARVSVAALINHPVVEQGRSVAILYVNDAHARTWRTDEVEFVREAADRLRQATERRHAEIGLQALNAQLESAVEVRTAERDRMWTISPDLMVILSLDGLYQRANPSWQAVLGYAPEELTGLGATALVHPDDVAATDEALRAAKAAPLPVFENRFRHKDGSYRWIQWVTAPSGGEIFATGRDVTEAKEAQARLAQAEELLRQSQKMEAVGQLTGGLAHDFNNLLAGISGSIEMMQARIRQERFADLPRYMAAAQGAVTRAAALTHRLLAFSRRQTLDPKVTDVNRLVDGMQDLIRRTVGPAIAFETTGTPDLWPVLVDPSQLENALLNLCINARDAMPDGGRIVVETVNKRLDERAARMLSMSPGEYVSLCVTDNGTGMPPEIVSRVFEPFFTTKPMGEGTGLGLSMIYGFAHQSGGQVRIYSEVGDGTTVCVYLPRQHGSADADDAAPEQNALPGLKKNARVLVVDDEPTVRLLVTDVVEDLGYTALEAENGPDGLKILASNERIDLLVTDVGLPGGMNGRQMADAARVKRPDLKVLFITGYAENAVVRNGHLEAGMAVLTKPFAMDAIANRIRSLVEGEDTPVQ